MERAKTLFIDIDGTLLHHYGEGIVQVHKRGKLLPGVLKQMDAWDRKGYNIILTTGRRESQRQKTEEQLLKAKIPYDRLIMGLGGGARVIINDTKPNSKIPTAFAITVPRNGGLREIEDV